MVRQRMICLAAAAAISVGAVGCGDADSGAPEQATADERPVPAQTFGPSSEPAAPQQRQKARPRRRPKTVSWEQQLYRALDRAGRNAVTADSSQAFASGQLRQWVADDRQCVTVPVFDDDGNRTNETAENCGHTVVFACVSGGRLTGFHQIITTVRGRIGDVSCVNGRVTMPSVE